MATVYYILNLGFTCASYGNLLEHGPSNIGIKASLKECKMENLVTTWAGPVDRGKNKTCQESADPRSALFTYNERSVGPGNYH